MACQHMQRNRKCPAPPFLTSGVKTLTWANSNIFTPLSEGGAAWRFFLPGISGCHHHSPGPPPPAGVCPGGSQRPSSVEDAKREGTLGPQCKMGGAPRTPEENQRSAHEQGALVGMRLRRIGLFTGNCTAESSGKSQSAT